MKPIPMALMASSIVAIVVYLCFVALGFAPFRLSAFLINAIVCSGLNVALVAYKEHRKAIVAAANKPLPRSGYEIGLYN